MVNGALASKQLVLSSWCLCVIQGQRFGVSFFLIQLQRSVKHRLPATVTASNDDGCLAETERLMACWHDAGRWAMPAMPLRSCPAECEARCMDLPRGLMCFHLRYMLFFVFFALESLNCKKDCERSWKMWNLPGNYKVCFFSHASPSWCSPWPPDSGCKSAATTYCKGLRPSWWKHFA